jgi:hypothetical protein
MSGQVWADQIVAKAADASVAFRVYNGYTGTLTYVVGTDTSIQTNTITCDGLANTLLSNDALTNGTIALLVGNVAACTNAAGTASLTVNSEPSLSADVTIGNLLPGTYTAVAGKWLEVLWDTSAHLSYDLYFPSRSYEKGVGAYTLSSIGSVPTGTGNVTASVYKDGTLIKQKIVTSPVYVNPATWLDGGTNVSTNSFTADDNVTIDWPVDLPFTGSEPVIVRVSRATTATTGNINAVIK